MTTIITAIFSALGIALFLLLMLFILLQAILLAGHPEYQDGYDCKNLDDVRKRNKQEAKENAIKSKKTIDT